MDARARAHPLAVMFVVLPMGVACKHGCQGKGAQGGEAARSTAGGERSTDPASVEDGADQSKTDDAAEGTPSSAPGSSTEPASSDRPPVGSGPSPAVHRASEPPAAGGTDGDAAPHPPDRPPENPFGYDHPVRGCFEGRVYALASKPSRLPDDYDELEQKGVLYACEWNVWPRKWEEGLPGLGDRYELFAIRYTGAFRVKKSGLYEFRLRSDDGSRLYVDGELVVNNDGPHAAHSETGEMELEAGDHSLELEYFQGHHHVNLQLWVTPPDGEEGLLSVRPR